MVGRGVHHRPGARRVSQGFLTSLVEEFVTGRGTLQQIGVATPSPTAFWTIIGLSGGLTLFATVQTLVKAQSKSIPPKCAVTSPVP